MKLYTSLVNIDAGTIEYTVETDDYPTHEYIVRDYYKEHVEAISNTDNFARAKELVDERAKWWTEGTEICVQSNLNGDVFILPGRSV